MQVFTSRLCAVFAVLFGLIAFGPLVTAQDAAAQEKKEITISRQPGINYMPTHVIERQKLIEKHAARLGLADLKINWVMLGGGGAQTDAMLANSVDIVNTGVTNLLLLWDRTKGGVKGVVGTSAQPLALISRNPNIKTLADFKEGDKIAVPTIKVSTQSMLMQIAASKMFGPEQWGKFDPLTVQMAHPDAAIAMTNASHEVANHFAAPPFQFFELKNVPGAHVVTTSVEIMGGPMTQANFFTTTKFADANPKAIEALKAAAIEAEEFIRKSPLEAAEMYKAGTGDKTSAQELVEMLKQPGMMEYGAAPQNTMKIAAHMFKTGTLKTMPQSWKDYYLPAVHDMKGD
jgi:NitT/TauT family transport system substrate-binding protein